MFLFFEGFQPQNALILLFFYEAYLLIAKMTPEINNSL